MEGVEEGGEGIAGTGGGEEEKLLLLFLMPCENPFSYRFHTALNVKWQDEKNP